MLKLLYQNKLICSAILIGLGFGQSYAKSEYNQSTVKQPNQLVTIIQLVDHPALNQTQQGIVDTLKASNLPISIEIQSAQGNPALASQIAKKFISQKPAVMVGIATMVSQALVAANKLSQIPVVFSSVTDPVGAGLVTDLNRPLEVTGVSNFVSPTEQFKFFKDILPNLKTIGVIYNPGEANSAALIKEMAKIAPQFGLKMISVSANSSSEVPSAAKYLVGKVDAIFINNDNTALSAIDSIIKTASEIKIPVLCSDTDTVQRGVLAAIGPNQYDLGKQTAAMILEILKGKSITEIPVQFSNKTETLLNQTKAGELGIVFTADRLKNINKVIN